MSGAQFITDLTTKIAATTAITNLVGTRIYNAIASRNATNGYIVFHVITATSIATQDATTPLPTRRIQFDCVGNTALLAQQIEDAIITTFDGTARFTQGSTVFQAHFLQNSTTRHSPEFDRYVNIVDIQFTYSN